jgi:hypothetical protein
MTSGNSIFYRIDKIVGFHDATRHATLRNYLILSSLIIYLIYLTSNWTGAPFHPFFAVDEANFWWLTKRTSKLRRPPSGKVGPSWATASTL